MDPKITWELYYYEKGKKKVIKRIKDWGYDIHYFAVRESARLGKTVFAGPAQET